MNAAQEIILRFGGASSLARLLGKTPSMVQYWARTGLIPAKWQSALLALAREHGIPLTPRDFIQPSEDRQQAIEIESGVPFTGEWRGILSIGGLELPVSFRLSAVH